MFSRYLPVRAFSMAGRLISEAKICTGKAAPVSFRYSCNAMAMENASSPVAQPATQTRIVSFADRALENAGEDDFLQAFERFRIAEEAGHADEQIPLERHQLIGIALQPLAVLREAVDIAQGEAAQDAALDHLLPVERKVDAGGPVQNSQDVAEPLFVAGRRSLLFRGRGIGNIRVPANSHQFGGNAAQAAERNPRNRWPRRPAAWWRTSQWPHPAQTSRHPRL